MNTITVQSPALAAVERQIPGVAHAYDEAPDTILGNLPAFVNFPGQANMTWNQNLVETPAGEFFEGIEARQWSCALYVAARGEGVEGEIIRRCYPFFDWVRDALQGHQSLGGAAGVLKVTYQGDNGIAFERLKYQEEIYSGIVFRVQVTTRLTSAIAPGE